MGCAGSVPDDRRNRCPRSPGHSGGRAAAALNNHDMTNTTDSPRHRSTRVVEWIDAYNRYLGEGLLDMKPSTMSPSISSASTVTSSWNSNSRGGVVPQTTSRQQQQHLRSERFGSSGQAVTNIGVIPTDTAPPPALRSSFTGLGGNRVPNHRGSNPTMMNNNNRNIIRNPLRAHEDAETSLIALEQEERYLSASPQLPPRKQQQQQQAGATPATTMASAALGMALLNAGQGGSIGSVPSIHIPSPVQLQYQQAPPPRRQQPSSLGHHNGRDERGTYQNDDDDDHNRDGESVRDDDDDEHGDENNSPPSQQSQRPALVVDITTLSSGQAAAVVNSGGGVVLDGAYSKTSALVPLHEDLSRHSPSSTPLVHVMHIGDGSTSSAVRHISGGESFPMQRGFTEGSPTRITSSKHAVE